MPLKFYATIFVVVNSWRCVATKSNDWIVNCYRSRINCSSGTVNGKIATDSNCAREGGEEASVYPQCLHAVGIDFRRISRRAAAKDCFDSREGKEAAISALLPINVGLELRGGYCAREGGGVCSNIKDQYAYISALVVNIEIIIHQPAKTVIPF